jgi:hypothetical protein
VLEMLVFFVFLEGFAENKKQIKMIVDALVFADMIEEIFFGNDAAESMENGFEFVKNFFFFLVFLRLANRAYGVIFDLSDSFASDVVLFTDSFKVIRSELLPSPYRDVITSRARSGRTAGVA